MFKVVRQAKIKEILLDRNQVDVQTLSSLLNVSSVTIRNDLEALEDQGFLIRTHGGAVLNDTMNRDNMLSVTPKQSAVEYDKDKDDIAQIASNLVESGEWVFLGPGTTCGYIAKRLAGRGRFNVITNNLYVATSMPDKSPSNIIVTGGTLDVKGMFLSGELLDSLLKNIHVNKAFFSVAGVDLRGGYSVSSSAEMSLFLRLKEICDQLVIVADHSKFDSVSFMRIGSLNCANTLISNEGIPQKYKEFLFEHGVQLFTSYDIKPSSVRGDV